MNSTVHQFFTFLTETGNIEILCSDTAIRQRTVSLLASLGLKAERVNAEAETATLLQRDLNIIKNIMNCLFFSACFVLNTYSNSASLSFFCPSQACYGRSDAESVERVKALYDTLEMPLRYHQYEEESYLRLQDLIQRHAQNLPHAVFLNFAKKIYKRNKWGMFCFVFLQEHGKDVKYV